MVRLLAALSLALCSTSFAEARLANARLVDKYTEPDSWTNRSNFYFGGRGGIAIPAGANGIAPSAGIELGIANDFGMGFGLHVIWMNNTPGAPMFNIPPTTYGFGALADMRFYFATIEPLTLYPTLSIGFVAGPDATNRNAVLPMFNPGFGAKVKMGDFYGAFEFGFAGFTIPYVTVCFGYQGDRRRERAEAWAREQQELADQGPLRTLEEQEERARLSPPTLAPDPDGEWKMK